LQFGWRAPGRISNVLIRVGLADKASERGTQPEEDATEAVSQPEVDTAVLKGPPGTVLNGSHSGVTFRFERGEAPARIYHFLSSFALDDERDSAWQTI
jgi:hypothetical protein